MRDVQKKVPPKVELLQQVHHEVDAVLALPVAHEDLRVDGAGSVRLLHSADVTSVSHVHRKRIGRGPRTGAAEVD